MDKEQAITIRNRMSEDIESLLLIATRNVACAKAYQDLMEARLALKEHRFTFCQKEGIPQDH